MLRYRLEEADNASVCDAQNNIFNALRQLTTDLLNKQMDKYMV